MFKIININKTTVKTIEANTIPTAVKTQLDVLIFAQQWGSLGEGCSINMSSKSLCD